LYSAGKVGIMVGAAVGSELVGTADGTVVGSRVVGLGVVLGIFL